MTRTTPPDVDRVAAARAAVAARRARAAVKSAIAARERRALDVAEAAWSGQPAAPEATLRVRELLMSIPSLGPTRADRVMEQLGIAASKRVGGLGIRQRVKLREYLQQREGFPDSVESGHAHSDVDPATSRIQGEHLRRVLYGNDDADA